MSTITPAVIRDASAQWLDGDLGNLLGVVRRGWRLVAIAIVIALTLAVVYLAATKRMYLATTRLLVLQHAGRPVSVSGADTSRLVEGFEDFLATHIGVIRSPVIVGRAIEKVGMRNLPTLLQEVNNGRNPIDSAIDWLTVTRPDRTAKILKVSYEAGSRQEAIRMVNAISEGYKTFLEENYRQHNNRVVPLITKARDELKGELEAMQSKYLEFRKKNAIMTTDEAGRSFISRRLDSWDHISNETKLRTMQLRAQLNVGKQLAAEGTSMWAVANAMSQIGGNAGADLVSTAAGSSQVMSSDFVRELYQEQQKLAEEYGPQYTKVQEIQEQINRIQERMRDSKNRLDKTETKDLLRSTELSLKAVEGLRNEIVAMFDEDLSMARDFELNLLIDANLKENLERQKALFNTVVDQLKQAQLSSDFSSINAQTIEPPNALKKAVKPRIMLSLFLALMAGSVLGVMATLVADRLDTRISTIEELRSILRFNLLGVVPQLPKNDVVSSESVGLVCQMMPRSPSAEAYKSIRSNLELLRRNSRIQVILVTSPLASDGKSSTASNLAISLAQLGRKVLLIDADLRRPSQDRIHGINDSRGLAHVLKDLLPLDRVVQPSQVENLSLIAAGPEATNPAELLSSNRLAEFIEELRGIYHTVIIDSPPLLAVADPTIIGPLVDGVVLVVRDAVTKRHDAARTRELLEALGTPILGLVVNGFNFERSGQGYTYGAGYGSGRGTYSRSSNSRGQNSDEGTADTASSGASERHGNGKTSVNGTGPVSS